LDVYERNCNNVDVEGMSATIPNHDQIAKWLKGISFVSSHRPTELSEYYITPSSTKPPYWALRAKGENPNDKEIKKWSQVGVEQIVWDLCKEVQSFFLPPVGDQNIESKLLPSLTNLLPFR